MSKPKKRKIANRHKKQALTKEAHIVLKLLHSILSLRITKISLIGLILILLIPFIGFIVLRPAPQKDINYGVTFSNKYAQEIGLDWRDTYIKTLDDLGAKNLRLVAYWDDIEPVNDEYDFSDIEWQVQEAQKRDVNVILTVGLKVPRWPECFAPTWWNDLSDQNIKDIELYEYVKTTVNTLKKYPAIKKWQVENEPFFPFGHCPDIKYATVKQEADLVKSLDDRPIIVQDSGEGGLWQPTYQLGDYLAISMYRKIWFDFWKVFGGRSIYFKYPLAHWTYKIKANLVGVPHEKIVVTELQAEPWGPKINSELTEYEKNKTMSRNDFIDAISYAQKAGFKDLYLWGVEWWLWEKEMNDNPFYWNTAKAIFN